MITMFLMQMDLSKISWMVKPGLKHGKDVESDHVERQLLLMMVPMLLPGSTTMLVVSYSNWTWCILGLPKAVNAGELPECGCT